MAAVSAFSISATASACGSGADDSSSEEYSGPIVLKNVKNAKNVILLIGDGMGPNQIKAGEVYKGETLCMQQFPYRAMVETRSANAEITDSAAAGTALATGTRTNNGYVGVTTEKEELKTIMDLAQMLGKSTGVLTTEEISGATPMSFLSHAESRTLTDQLIAGAPQSGVNLIASYVIGKSQIQSFVDSGYTQIEDADKISESKDEFIIGSYYILAKAESGTNGATGLAFDRLVTEALEYLSQDKDGFVLMAEGAHIDHGGHGNNINYMLEELLAFDDAVYAALKWARNRDDTVVIVTADHETGGFQLNEGATRENLFEMTSLDSGFTYVPKYYEWTSTSHTATDVCCYINGADIDFAEYSLGESGRIKNTDVYQIMKNLIAG